MMDVTTPRGEKLVLLTEAEYRALVADAGDAALAAEARESPTLPADLARAVLAGALHPLTAWRKARGLSMAELAAHAGARVASVSDIENGKIDPRYSTLHALSRALGLKPDDIMP